MDGGLLSSPVHLIGMSVHPGSLKTAISITASNEKGFISALPANVRTALMLTHKHTRTTHVVQSAAWAFSASLAFSVITPHLISLSAFKFPHWSHYSFPLICTNSVSSSSTPFWLDHPLSWSKNVACISSECPMAPQLRSFCECVFGDEALLITAETL